MQELSYPGDNSGADDLAKRLGKARERITKLEDLVDELLNVYYHQDDGKITSLRRELGI
jgi:hypothetical protein